MKQKLDLNEIKKYSLDILDDVVRCCNILKIDYFLDGGTLLGAIRHNGYIPWDDDIDIVMKREDYERFCKEYNKLADKKYKLLTLNNCKKYFFSFAKVYDLRTKKYEHGRYFLHQGLSIDIFPLDRNFSDPVQAIDYQKKVKIYFDKYVASLSLVTCAYQKKVSKGSFLFNLKKFTSQYIAARKSAVELNNFLLKNNQNKENYGVLVVMYYNPTKFPRSFSLNDYTVVPHKFENRTYNIPVGFDKILTAYYNNYMDIPPENERTSTHCINVYWRNGIDRSR